MIKPRIHTAQARYLVTPAHRASAEFDHQQTRFCGLLHDVSKDHVCLLLARDGAQLTPGIVVTQMVISLLGRKFTLPSVSLTMARNDDDEDLLQYVFSGQADTQSAARLWEISYLLRLENNQQSDRRYSAESLPKVPARGVYSEDARQERLAFLRQQTAQPLTHVAETRLDAAALVSNIEALIGSVEIPLGVAGPLHVRGVHADGLFYAPMATSEGALVASATRGATAISRSGGVRARVLEQRMLRVPVFTLSSMDNAFFFAEWVQDHQQEISRQVTRYSNYARLTELRAQVMGRAVHVHFVYETGDAAGQNMTTTCTWQACQWIMTQMQAFPAIAFDNFLVEANLSNDKKVTAQSWIRGRGIRVIAEAILDAENCRRVLKVAPEQLVQAWHNFTAGSIAAGMMGININVANVIAAMFAATGQDIACVHESALAQLHLELTDSGDVYTTMTLPSLVIGTVGGGTNLPQQKECLTLLDCAGPGKAHKLAEIIASYCLALDISTLSAIASDQFARAHEKLGRNRPVDWLKEKDLDVELFNQITADSLGELASVIPLPREQLGSSIITELTSHKINKLVGHFPLQLVPVSGQPREVIAKIKPLDDEVILMLNSMAAMCDARLAQEFNRFRNQLGFKGCHVRELRVMSQQDPRFTRHAPKVYGTLTDSSREAFIIVEEKLSGLELMDSADDARGWTDEHLHAAITGIAEVHSIWYGREDALLAQPWSLDCPSSAGMLEKTRLWEMLGVHCREEFPEWFSEQDMQMFRAHVSRIGDWWRCIEKMPRTLIHNDFNPRNIAFRRDAKGLQLCAYDWELATLHLPQHDLVELLCFTLNGPISAAQLDHWLTLHRQTLQQHSGVAIDAELWRKGYRLSLFDLMVNRMPMYVMAHTFRHYKFMQRAVTGMRQLLELEGVFHD